MIWKRLIVLKRIQKVEVLRQVKISEALKQFVGRSQGHSPYVTIG